MNKFKPYYKHDPYFEDQIAEAKGYCQCKTKGSFYDKEQDKFICPDCQKIKEEPYNERPIR